MPGSATEETSSETYWLPARQWKRRHGERSDGEQGRKTNRCLIPRGEVVHGHSEIERICAWMESGAWMEGGDRLWPTL